MKGLTQTQLIIVTDFVQKHHSFPYVTEENRVTKFPFGIKYIDTCYDSRDQSVWYISFRGMSGSVVFRTNHFTALNLPPKGWKYDNLFDLCMAFLKGEFVPKEEFYMDEDKPAPTKTVTLERIRDHVGKKFSYDREGQMIFGNMPNGHQQQVLDLRGWGHIQNMFKDAKGDIDLNKAMKFQDDLGEWITETLNERLKNER